MSAERVFVLSDKIAAGFFYARLDLRRGGVKTLKTRFGA